MITIQDFKQDFLASVFNISKNTFLPIAGILVIFHALFLALVGIVFVTMGFENLDFFEDKFFNFIDDPLAMISLIVPFALVLYFLMSWVFYFHFLVIDRYIKENKIHLIDTFIKSFSKKVFSVYVAVIFIMVLYVAFSLICVFIIMSMGYSNIALSIILGVFMFLALLTFLFHFILVMPHILNTDSSAILSMIYSFKKTTVKSAIKYVFIFLLAYIMFGMFSYTITYSIMNECVVGIVIASIIQVLLISFIGSVILSSSLGLYYTYNPKNLSNSEEKNELLDESLIDIEIEDEINLDLQDDI